MKISGWAPYIRLGLYAITMMESTVVFCITAARLHHTLHRRPSNRPFSSTSLPFYDPIVVILLFASLTTIAWSIFVFTARLRRLETFFVTTWLGEIVALCTLWLFWIVSTGIASSYWGSGLVCQYYQECQLLAAMLANAWVTWAMLLALLIFAISFGAVKMGLYESVNDRNGQEITLQSESETATVVSTSEGTLSFDGSLEERKEKMWY